MNKFKIRVLAVDYLIDRLKDWKALIIAIALPIVIILLFGNIINKDGSQYKLGVYGFDGTDEKEFLNHEINPYKLFEIVTISSIDADTITKAINDEDLTGVLTLKKNDSKSVLSFYPNYTMQINSSIVQGILRSSVETINQRYQDEKIFLEMLGGYVDDKQEIIKAKNEFSARATELNLTDRKVSIVESEIENGINSSNPYNNILPGMAGMFILFTALFGGIISIIEDRDQKIFQRLRTIPFSRTDIVVGKILGIFLFCMIQTLTLVLFGKSILGMIVSDAIALRLIIISYVFMVTSFSIFLSTLIKRKSQIDGVVVPVVLLLSVIGGYWFPLENASAVLKTISAITPTGIMMNASQEMLNNNASFIDILPYFGGLMMFGLVFMTIGIKNIKWIDK